MTKDRVTLTIDTKRLRRAIVAVILRVKAEAWTPEQMADQIWLEYARISTELAKDDDAGGQS